jgi:DNA-binding CsgD family transcriptional regulator
MRALLLELALTSNGRTSSWDVSSAGERDHTPHLGRGDAPELELAAAYEAAADDDARRAAIQGATETLDRIRRSRATTVVGETKTERDARIVRDGEGERARDVAIAIRCGIRDVWAARAANGRDTEFGRPCLNGGSLTRRERQARVLELTGDGMSARAVAGALGVSYATVLRDLGRKA